MQRRLDDIQDELLVLESQAGDRNALRQLVARWQPRLLRLAWRLTGDVDAARDATQEAWLAIVRGLRRLSDPSGFPAWACRIVANKCADWVRRRAAERKHTGGPMHPEAVGDAPVKGASGSTDVRSALAGLAPDQRAILCLHYLEGMRIADIANTLGIPPGTVKSRLHAARLRLRQALERNEP